MIEVGDLVISVNGWEGWIFVVTDLYSPSDMGGYDPEQIKCVVIKAPALDRGFPVGYALRWLAATQFRKI